MPIYAYRCASCGHAKDVLQKLRDPKLTICPACGAATFRKQLTTAGFQLKGSGWYATDFKSGGQVAPPAEPAAADKDKPATADKSEKAAAAPATAKAEPAASAAPASATLTSHTT